jgi:hypothetical protein
VSELIEKEWQLKEKETVKDLITIVPDCMPRSNDDP